MTDRDKLIELIDQSRITRTEHSVCINGSAHMADFLIANGVTFAKDTNVPSKWVPVTERLPEECMLVMAYNGDLEICLYERAKFIVYDDNGYLIEQRYVTHWMPLPEPPKEN